MIATDSFHLPAPIGRFHHPWTFEIPRGAPLERALPVPRPLLRAPIRRLSVDGDLLDPAPADPSAAQAG